MYLFFLGKQDSTFVCRHCLSSYSSQFVLIKHKQRCNQQGLTSIETSNESHLYWKKNTFIRIHHVYGYMHIFKLIPKLILVI